MTPTMILIVHPKPAEILEVDKNDNSLVIALRIVAGSASELTNEFL